MKYSFRNDYSEGCHPAILKALNDNNCSQEDGYSEDKYSLKAIETIRNLCNQTDADIHFLTGGTQANLVMLAHALRPYESVIANEMAHIATHEAGAIEATGHKINIISRADGKLVSEDIQVILDEHYFEHMVAPKLVFISNTTEIGTVYKKKELKDLYEYCQRHNLYLYIDGARLGSALTAETNDATLEDIAKYSDAFYIGGTKNGFLIGEALIITNNELKSHMRYQMKQRGALLAKGRIFGIQFQAMFEDNLYFELAKHTNFMAKKLSDGIAQLGFNFLTKPESNQIFPILPNTIIRKLEEAFGFYAWQKIDDKQTAIRLVCSWKTEKKQIEAFLSDLKALMA